MLILVTGSSGGIGKTLVKQLVKGKHEVITPRSKEINFSYSESSGKRSRSFKIEQFPFACATGSTVYKVQGETLQFMVVVDWKSNRGVPIDQNKLT